MDTERIFKKKNLLERYDRELFVFELLKLQLFCYEHQNLTPSEPGTTIFGIRALLERVSYTIGKPLVWEFQI